MALLDQKTPYLYFVRSEFSDPDLEADWNAWYNDFDIPAMLDLPGIESAIRYREVTSPSRYLAAYEIENPAVFENPDYQKLAGWMEWAPYIGESRRAVYKLVEDLGPVR